MGLEIPPRDRVEGVRGEAEDGPLEVRRGEVRDLRFLPQTEEDRLGVGPDERDGLCIDVVRLRSQIDGEEVKAYNETCGHDHS